VAREILYRLIADETRLVKSLKNSEAQITKTSQTFITKGKLIAAGIGGAVALVVKGYKDLVKEASNAQETTNKFNVVYSKVMTNAASATDKLTQSYGLSSVKAQQLLSDTGDLLTGFGFTQQSALELSSQVNELAVDLASFTNFSGGAEGASAALTKALLGEREAIKSLGISIGEADIARLAEKKGITGELDRQTKAMLTLELAVSQSKNAIGDFSRSQDAYANQMRVAASRTQELAVTLGNRLIPSATKGVSTYVKLVEAIQNAVTDKTDLNNATKNLISSSTAYNKLVDQIASGTANLSEKERILLESRKELARIEASRALANLSEGYKKATDEISKLTAEQDEQEERVNSYLRLMSQYNQILSSPPTQQLEMVRALGVTVEGTQQAYEGAAKSLEKYNRDLLKTQEELTGKEFERAEALRAVAQGYRDGVIDISVYKLTNKELYNQIIELADGMALFKEESAGIGAITEEYVVSGEQRAALLRDQWNDLVVSHTRAYDEMNAKAAEFAEREKQRTERLRQIQQMYVTQTLAGFAEVGEALVKGENAQKAFAKAAILAVASVIEAIAAELAARAALSIATLGFFNPAAWAANAGLLGKSAAAYALAGGVRALAGSFAEGGAFTVPQGYPNDSYPIPAAMVQSSERVTIETPEQVREREGGNMVFEFYFSEDKFAEALAKPIRNGRVRLDL